MEANPALENEHFVAERLGMTVHRLRREMPNAEFVNWLVYFGRKQQREELARGGRS